MKKVLKITAIVLCSLFVLLLLLPLAFRGKIREAAKNEINRSLNAEVKFDKAGLSLIRNFPNLTLTLSGLTVAGTGEFQGDTLTVIPYLRLTLDLSSVISGDVYKVRNVVLDGVDLRLKVLANGKANWDIMKETGVTDTVSAPSSFKADLNSVELRDCDFSYDDAEISTLFACRDISGDLSGDMTLSVTTLQVNAGAREVICDYEGIRYVNKAVVSVNTGLQADIDKYIFTFKNGELSLNDLRLTADGMFAMPENGYDMDITFKAKENTFRAFLSLIPAIYSREFSALKAEGTMSFDGFVKGKYTDNQIPAFAVNLAVSNGSFSYPDLPGKVSDVNVRAFVSNPDGVTDHTVVDVQKLHLLMVNNPLDAAFTLKTPVSDPEINGYLKGRINLGEVAGFYPLGEKTSLSGTVNADISLAGRVSSIEQGKYEQFKASGFAVAEKVNYASPDFPNAISIPSARLDFSPAFISVSGFRASMGKSDLSADGKLENYLPWFLKSTGVLRGQLKASSAFMDINELMGQAPATASSPDTSAVTAVELPGNMDMTVNTVFGHVIYDKYDLKDVTGNLRLKDKVLYLDGLSMNTLGGNMALSGTYDAREAGKPKVDLDVKIRSVEVKQVAATFNTMKVFAPVAEKMAGLITTNIKLSGDLKPDMMPVLTSVSGSGLVLSDLLSLENINTLNLAADVLQIEKLRKPAIEKLNLSWDLANGLATVKPTDFMLGKYKANLSGTTGLDQAINYVLNLEIPRSDFGSRANNALNSLVADATKKGIKVTPGDVVPVTLLIGGTLTNPKVTAGLKQALSGVVEDLKQQALKQVQQKKEEVVAKAREEANKAIEQADAEAARIIAEAEVRSGQILQAAQVAAGKAKAQADSAANKLVAEAKKKGPVAEIAAKTVANRLRQEGSQRADKLLAEAGQQSEGILSRARAEADRVKQAAREKAK